MEKAFTVFSIPVWASYLYSILKCCWIREGLFFTLCGRKAIFPCAGPIYFLFCFSYLCTLSIKNLLRERSLFIHLLFDPCRNKLIYKTEVRCLCFSRMTTPYSYIFRLIFSFLSVHVDFTKMWGTDSSLLGVIQILEVMARPPATSITLRAKSLESLEPSDKRSLPGLWLWSTSSVDV